MLILAIETCSRRGGLALLQDGSIRASIEFQEQRGQSEKINQGLEFLYQKAGLKPKDTELIACDHGPGSFTGIRVGLSVAKAWAYALQVPVFATDSLAIMAYGHQDTTVCALNAFRRMLYWSAFRGTEHAQMGTEPLQGPTSIGIDELPLRLSQLGEITRVLTDSPDLFATHKLKVQECFPSAENLAKLAFEASQRGLVTLAGKPQTLEWNSLTPLYLRGSEAEENLRK